MSERTTESRRAARWLAAASLAVLGACGGSSTAPTRPGADPSPASGSVPNVPLDAPDEEGLLEAAYRVDIESIEAIYDVFPSSRRVEARAAVTFRMQPGQSRPLFHFLPGSAGGTALALDGAPLDPGRQSDVRFFQWSGSGQVSMELQRDLEPAVTHRLEASYALSVRDAFGRFYTDVNDLAGRGNEDLFPSINSPRELARHVLVLRVHDAEPYQCVGSGRVVRTGDAEVQEWILDTEREVASYTVLFYLVPDADVIADERVVSGVDVRVLGYPGGSAHETAFAELEPWLAELQRALGPFPMPRGISIVLTPTGGGMEYYGGTITSIRALRHEVFHMYYGCSTVARTYRDSWWDEAINSWYELSADPSFPAIDPAFTSGIVGARTPLTVGFDRRAYDEGARIIQAVAADLGGRDAGVRFLKHLHQARSFDPFTTEDLASEILASSGADFRDRFHRWLYASTASAGSGTSPRAWLHEVDLTPPLAVQERHRSGGRSR